ncbi:hypothetical protein JQK87_12460 [Streptomyces sp. G44]|uniref:hypothetical protein n=1 Tax=Streptomyces sp. G44 TaxID=2807632 RepID=UPI00195F46B9|nr:hypothetical protein [Streptomyces sp. G44]MBM7169217.1 hypothetical protein [Streptomyces sp. G44]
MSATEDTSAPGTPRLRAHLPLEEAAWRCQVGWTPPEDLPMAAAEALAAGLDGPALVELAGMPRNADPRDIRDAFEQALSEVGVALPGHRQARRHALRALAVRCAAGETDLAELASDDWWETEGGSAEERAFVALLPPCTCCLEYTLGLDEEEWRTQLRTAALALAARPAVTPR